MSESAGPNKLTPALRAALEALAMVRDGRARLNGLLSVAEEQRPDLGWDALMLGELLAEAMRQGLVYQDQGAWVIAQQGRDLLQQLSTDDEQRDDPSAADNWRGAPFDPASLKVTTVNDPVFSVLDQIKNGMIWLQPAFQRNFVWNATRQSQLIESILLRIPLPAFYLDATSNSRSQVMDGLQRLSTLDAFCNKKTLKLKGLRYLQHFESAGFDDLPASMQQLILHQTRLTMHTIQTDTPRWVRFEVFSRVNTGGLTLTAQEIRHALYQGKATQLLRQLAEDDTFQRVTTRSISPLRMDDRECVLRFLAFSLYDYTSFRNVDDPNAPANLDDLLNQTMEDLNQLPDFTIEQQAEIFRDSLTKAAAIFDRQAFRKLSIDQLDRDKLQGGEIVWNSSKRSPISKPLFEAWMVLLRPYSLQELAKYRTQLVRGFVELLSDNEFAIAISLGTGSRRNILYRFGQIEQLLQRVMV